MQEQLQHPRNPRAEHLRWHHSERWLFRCLATGFVMPGALLQGRSYTAVLVRQEELVDMECP